MNDIISGKLKRWNDEKGFGFVQSENQKNDIFIHISAFKNMPRRPIVGDVIYYQIHVGDDGKTKAINARIEGVAFVKTKKSPRKMQNKKQNQWVIILFALVIFVALGSIFYSNLKLYVHTEPSNTTELAASKNSSHDLILKNVFEHRTSNVQVEGEGIISKILPDDMEGDKHQKFIVRLNSGQTLLIAHNIDLAGRIDAVQEGDSIAFNGEYEWNAKGGVIHWTHHDPNGNHVQGWIKHNGQTYQ
ncbi:MAG: DUF3465 domain-containing protein [Methylovulum sp.]|uniref:DUF3465 domain-containing protein n=1 Tax=Methylovulum sp. TaxID=1916980 RepID=UPI002605B29C|nr:DUF3465 domain-containing protein [Methylovulum sp.]MDD2725297.1 DUF3465 domain-containing protein [Methylovulum sp.]MDD5125126.1 DUF3465 domain-containing protein [Methylovulum sp.]